MSAATAFSIGLVNALLYCYFGTMTSESYAKMGNHLFELNWFELPIKQQKYFIVMGANMQRPSQYLGFGVMIVDLETFVGVNFQKLQFLLYCFCRRIQLMTFVSFSVVQSSALLLCSNQKHHIQMKHLNGNPFALFNYQRL